MSSSSDEEPVRRVHPVFRPITRTAVNSAAVEAKRRRRAVMLQDGYSEWQMNRAEAQRIADGIGDDEGVTQSVFRYANAGSQSVEPEPEPMAERVKAMSEPVLLVPPHLREFLPASIPGVTVCRPWAAPRSESAQ